MNFISVTRVTYEQLTSWGLSDSKKHFLTPDMIVADTAMFSPEYLVKMGGRGRVTSWLPQEQVMKHHAVGVFLTHSSWNSTIESITSDVPVICRPFFVKQQMKCKYYRVEWEIRMEIIKRDELEELIRVLIKV